MKIPTIMDSDQEQIETLEASNGKVNNEVHDLSSKDEFSVSFTPKQAHIFGGLSLFFSFVNIDTPLSEETLYYVIFEGSKLRHITSAKVLNPYTLQVVIPDHDEAELVMLSVCYDDDNCKDVSDRIMATDTFVFTSDSSQFLAQQLASNSLNSSSLQHIENVYSSLLDTPANDRPMLDKKITTSFRNIGLPLNWSIAVDTDTEEENKKSWTLLHFCAKHTLPQLAGFLLTKPGVKKALQTVDINGHTPLEISILKNNKRMVEIFSRVPCEEEINQESKPDDESKQPSVKRHKLGTTTITNTVTDNKEDLTKDLMLLKELDKLAAASKDPVHGNGVISSSEDPSPLAESLKKLQEINEEIRRLRSLSYKETMEPFEKEVADYTDTNGNVITDEKEDQLPEDSYVEVSINDSSSEDLLDKTLDSSQENKIEEEELAKDTEDIPEKTESEIDEKKEEVTCIEDAEKTESEPIKNQESVFSEEPQQIQSVEQREVSEEDSKIDYSRRLSNVSVSTIEVTEAEVIEILPTSFEEAIPVTEIVIENSEESVATVEGDPDVADSANYFKLESVTEETEEELKADVSPVMRRPKHDGLVSSTQTRSLSDLPPHPPKRVGILKRSGAKKDRPLSDSFENLKMVERQGIVEMYQGGSNALVNTPESGLTRGHSLDALMTEVDGDGLNSEMSSTSQLSVNGTNGSEESLTSECDSTKSRSRSGSEKFSNGSYRASSLLSLNDVQISRCSSTSSQEEFVRITKKPSLLSRISFKKAKSMSSLEMKKKDKNTLDEDRRKTITGGIDLDYLPTKSAEHDDSESNFDVITHEDMCGDILVRCVSYDNEVKKSQSSVSIENLGKNLETENYGRKFANQEDEDTDEGTSFEIAERHAEHDRKSSQDEKQKKRYGLFRGKPKEKKSQKEKKDHRERKDSDAKNKKKAQPSKPDFGLPNKLEKATFLTKRGTSFRTFTKSSGESKANEKPVFRGSSISANNKHDANNKLRADRKSPKMNRKVSTALHEEPHESDTQSMLSSRNLAGSCTSLDSIHKSSYDDDIDAAYIAEEKLEYDSDLDARDEPETWSELVDKKVQRKMHAKDIKRQDVIYELIQTEAQYVRVLQIMRKIYARGMVRSLNMDPDVVSQIFPLIDDLIELNGGFYAAMKMRQVESVNYIIENIGDTLEKFFGGESGEMLKQVYGHFCSHHLEAVSIYKEYLKSDKKYANFMKNCLLNDRTRRLSIPECITYVTIRMTKYPLLIEAIIKATKESKEDWPKLKNSLKLVKEVLKAVDEAVNIYEQQKELALLKKNLDRKHVVEIKGANNTKKTYKTTYLFHKRSRLLYDKKTVLRGKSKSHDTRMIVLAEKIIFFQDNGGKLQLLSADNKAPVLPLKNLMVREVATDNKALFLVSTSKDAAQIYEIVCDSYKDKKEFMPKLQGFIKACPEEEEDNLTDLEEEARREEEERVTKLKEIIDHLQAADYSIARKLSEKTSLVNEMRDIIESMDDVGPIKGSPCSELKPTDVANARDTLEACLTEVNRLESTLCSSQVDLPIASPSPSPGASNTSINNTKKSDVFTGYDQRIKPSVSSGSVNRSVSTNRMSVSSKSSLETDLLTSKTRKNNAILTVIGRTKTIGSTEDLQSISSSTSNTSISTIGTTISQISLFQNVKDNLSALVEVTGKQDVEIGKMRLELQENRAEMSKLKLERKELQDKLVTQQKDSERSTRHDKEQLAKIARDFKRSSDKVKQQLEEKNMKYLQLVEDLKPLGIYVLGGKPTTRADAEDGMFV